jgi:hypothetical protein
MQITFTVPAETITKFVIAAERAPVQLSSVIPWRMCRAHRRRAAETLGTARLEVSRYRGSQSPVPASAKHQFTVTSAASLADQPEAAQVARAAAVALAQACDGVIVDPLTGRSLIHRAGEPESFRLTDHWLGWRVDIDDDTSCPPTGSVGNATCACLTVTTRGLSRFGLPEIMLEGAACGHGRCAVHLLRSVAQQLLLGHLAWAAEHPRGGPRTIDDHVRVGTGPQARARLVPRDGDRLCLRLGPPGDFDGGVNAWLCQAA